MEFSCIFINVSSKIQSNLIVISEHMYKNHLISLYFESNWSKCK